MDDARLTGERTRIATIKGLPDAEVGRARYHGYLDARASGGLTPYALETGDFTVAGDAAAMRALLDRHPGLDAGAGANDGMAAGALTVLRERGRRVPDDVAVVGFDDVEIAVRTDPPLTTVHQPVRAPAARWPACRPSC